MIGRILLISGILGGVGFAYDRYQKRKYSEGQEGAQAAAERRKQMDDCMGPIWSEPRPLIEDVVKQLDGPGSVAATAETGRIMEVPLTPQAQADIWSFARYLSEHGQTEEVSATAVTILNKLVAPECDWTDGYSQFGDDPRFRQVWESVVELVNVAELSMKYHRVPETSGALVAPGWTHERPAPTGDVRSGDFLEVMVDRESGDIEDPGAFVEWAWVRVDEVGPKGFEGTVTSVAPPGDHPHSFKHAATHGVDIGRQVIVPARFVHRVIHGK